MKHSPVTQCCFAWPGTYGHECGGTVVAVAVKVTDMTADGLFFGGRCAIHGADCKGGDNDDVILRWESPSGQLNKWDNGAADFARRKALGFPQELTA